MLKRFMYQNTWRELSAEKAMIFMAGPRQVGKTTLAGIISKNYRNRLYCNWDIPEDRARLIENPSFFEEIERRDSSMPLVVFDEIHKFRDWKNYLKGVYDQFHDQFQFLVSGSGRLDTYQRGGDSLAGRYYQFHLWPLTVAELASGETIHEEFLKDPLQIRMDEFSAHRDAWASLSETSGFPEPFLSGKKSAYRRWSETYSRQLIREDVRDLTAIKSIADLETLYYLLPSRVGSPLSIPALSGDLKVSYQTVRNWLMTLERFFLIFSLSPWTKHVSRAIQKERKVYIWDAPRIKPPAQRFENLVAIELFRALSCWNDLGHGRFSLHFIKNKEQEEVDFLVANDNEPLFLVEAKLAATRPSKALLKFQNMLKIPAVQLVENADGFRRSTNNGHPVLIAPACQWCAALP